MLGIVRKWKRIKQIPSFHTCKMPSGELCPVSRLPSQQESCWQTGVSPLAPSVRLGKWSTWNMKRGWWHWVCSALRRKGWVEILLPPSTILKEGVEKMEQNSSPKVHRERTKFKCTQAATREVLARCMGDKSPLWGWSNTGTVTQRGSGTAILGVIQNLSEQDSEQPELSWP